MSRFSKFSKFNGLEARTSEKVSVDNIKSTFSKFANQYNVSTNERRSLRISKLESEGSFQLTNHRQACGVKRKGNWTEGISSRNQKQRRFNSDDD